MAMFVELTVAQAIVRYLQNQYSEFDGQRTRLVGGIWGIFGHGNVASMSQAIFEYGDRLPYFQPKNEQSMVHAAIGYAKAMNRRGTMACSASIGPGATNMITGAATATVNRVPVLLFPSDVFAHRRSGNVLQQLEHPVEADLTVNDCFRPVSRFFDRIWRPEQLITALPEAMRVLADPAETGAVTIAIPQDVQGEAYDYPEQLFEERVWEIRRRAPSPGDVARAAAMLKEAKRPLLIAGGGVRYSEAEAALSSASRAWDTKSRRRSACALRAPTKGRSSSSSAMERTSCSPPKSPRQRRSGSRLPSWLSRTTATSASATCRKARRGSTISGTSSGRRATGNGTPTRATSRSTTRRTRGRWEHGPSLLRRRMNCARLSTRRVRPTGRS